MNASTLAVAVILALTALPTGFRWPSCAAVRLDVEPADILLNVLLYVPLGLTLSRRSLSRVGLLAGGLSASVEVLQLFMADRMPGPADVIANTAGALLGSYAGRPLQQLETVRLDRKTAAAAAVLVLLLCASWVVVTEEVMITDFSNWDREFHLAVGNEITLDRPWRGQILELAVLRISLSGKLISEMSDQGPGSIGSNQRVMNRYGLFYSKPPSDLKSVAGRPLLGGSEADRFYERLVQSSSLTILAWCRTSELNQHGPTRIVTYSQDPTKRNFTLGQEGRSVVFRLRTPASGSNGDNPDVKSPPILHANEDTLIAATYDGEMSRVYVGGHLRGHADLAAEDRFYRLIPHEWVPIVPLILGGLLAASLVGLAQTIDARLRWCVAGVGGFAGGLLFLAGKGDSALPELGMGVLVLALAGGFTVAAGLLPAATLRRSS